MKRRLTLKQRVALLLKRKKHYNNLLRDKSGAINNDANIFLSDLRSFCRADGTSTFSVNDPYGRRQALLEGRREVFERILSYLNASDKEIKKMLEVVPKVD
jgi:hypothetical protein